MTVPVTGPPYAPRRYVQLGTWTAGALRLKAYGITSRTETDGPPTWLQDAASRYVTQELPAHAEAHPHHGLGFVIVHEGEQGGWLLADWWVHNDICCQRLAHAPEGSKDFAAVDRPFLGCVWELVVHDFERRTWVQTMLTEQPDPDAYLGARLPEGLH